MKLVTTGKPVHSQRNTDKGGRSIRPPSDQSWVNIIIVARNETYKKNFTSKEGFSCEHLSKDAASCPHVDGFGVVIRREQQTRRSIPLGD